MSSPRWINKQQHTSDVCMKVESLLQRNTGHVKRCQHEKNQREQKYVHINQHEDEHLDRIQSMKHERSLSGSRKHTLISVDLKYLENGAVEAAALCRPIKAAERHTASKLK